MRQSSEFGRIAASGPAFWLLVFDRFLARIFRHFDMPEIAGQGMVYDGYRFRAEASLGGKLYGDPFGVDIGFADVLTAQPDLTQGSRFFEFAGIEPATFRLYPRHAHIAEKLHAYTMPRDRTNTRVKDLPDIALLASVGPNDALELRRAIEATFSFRGTHPVPEAVPIPASEWAPVYERMAARTSYLGQPSRKFIVRRHHFWITC